MGLRMQKTIKLGKHLNINLSKSGVGISAGVKGARVGIGPKGVRTTASIPGTGIRYTKQSSLKSSPAKRNKTSKKVPVTARESGKNKVVVEVYGEKLKEQRADKPIKLTKRDAKKGVKIVQKHQRQEAKAAKSGGCLGCCVAAVGMLTIPVLIIGLMIVLIL